MKHNFWTKRNIILIIIAAIILAAGGYYLYARKFSMLPDNAIGLLSTVHEPAATDRVLIISPHFDDETIAAGGYIQRAGKLRLQIKTGSYGGCGTQHKLA